VKGEHGRWKVARIREFEIELLFFFGLFRETCTNHLGQGLFSTLRLLGILGSTLSKSSNVILNGLDLFLLRLELLFLVFLLFALCFDKLVVVSIVVL